MYSIFVDEENISVSSSYVEVYILEDLMRNLDKKNASAILSKNDMIFATLFDFIEIIKLVKINLK